MNEYREWKIPPPPPPKHTLPASLVTSAWHGPSLSLTSSMLPSSAPETKPLKGISN